MSVIVRLPCCMVGVAVLDLRLLVAVLLPPEAHTRTDMVYLGILGV